MAKRIFYNVPCTIFQNYLKDDKSRERVLSNVLIYVVYGEYLRLQDEIPDEAARFDTACRNMGSNKLNMSEVLYDGPRMFKSGKKEAVFSFDSEKYWEEVNEDKPTEERALFLSWLALKSIQGNKPFAKTCNAMWLSRMDGSSKIKQAFRKGCSPYSDAVDKFNNHYQCRKLKAKLMSYYHVSFYDGSGIRGFYFSLTTNMDDLQRAIMESQKTDVMTMYKEAMRKARESRKHNGNQSDNQFGKHNGNLK